MKSSKTVCQLLTHTQKERKKVFVFELGQWVLGLDQLLD